MISFDDLVDFDTDIQTLEDELRNVKVNTQVNRFSLYDCTDSIESLSSNTLMLYNSLSDLTTISGGGFDYYQSFTDRSEGKYIYNCVDTVINSTFDNFSYNVGPGANFKTCSFTNKKFNISGDYLSSNTFYVPTCDLNYTELYQNTLSLGNFDISCISCLKNLFTDVQHDRLTAIYVNSNKFSSGLHSITCEVFNQNTVESRAYIDVVGFKTMANNYIYGTSKTWYDNSCLFKGFDFSYNYVYTVNMVDNNAYYNSLNRMNYITLLNYKGYQVDENTSSRDIMVFNTNYSMSKCEAYDVEFNFNTVYSMVKNTFTNHSDSISSKLLSCINNSMISNVISNYRNVKAKVYDAFSNNNFYNIDELTLNYYGTNFNNNGLYNIKKLHVNTPEIIGTISTNNISSYYFKYTDGLYSSTDYTNSNIPSAYAYVKYVPCSWLNKTYSSSSSPGGFDYWESYSIHPEQGYNISDTLKSIILNNNIVNVGPAFDLSSCTLGQKYFNITGNGFIGNYMFNNTVNNNFNNMSYQSVYNNSFLINGKLNMTANYLSSNEFKEFKVLNITCNPVNVNTFSSCDYANIVNCGTFEANVQYNKNINISGGIINNGVYFNNKMINFNVNAVNNINYDNDMGNISCFNIATNTFRGNNLKINCNELKVNTLKNNYLDINCNVFSQNMLQDINKLDIKANSLHWASINMSMTDKITSAQKINDINITFNEGIANNFYKVDNLKLCGLGFTGNNFYNVDYLTISCYTLEQLMAENVKVLDLYYKDMDLSTDNYEYSDYHLSNIDTLNIHLKSSYTGPWNAFEYYPIAAFSNNVKCLNFDGPIPTYMLNNGVFNGANYGYVGYHISDIYINNIPYSSYVH